MNENEIMNTEIMNTELTETSALAETSNNGLETAAKVGTFALIGLGIWKAGELVVKGVKKGVAWFKNRTAKNQSKTEQKDVFDNMPDPNDDCFDANK